VLKDSYKLHQRHPKTASLASLIEIGLRENVGEKYWRRAKAIQRKECSVSVKSICRGNKQSVFTVNTGSNKIDLEMPLNIR